MRSIYVAMLVSSVLAVALCQQIPKTCPFCQNKKCLFHLPANRQLTPKESQKMKLAIQILLNRKYKSITRAEAARILGWIGHIDALGPLKQIAFNAKEDEYVRYWAITALSAIADKRVIPMLIDLTTDDKIGARAREQLWKLTELRFLPGIEPLKKGERWKDWWIRNKNRYRKAWMDWWEKNKDTFVFDRSKVLVEY